MVQNGMHTHKCMYLCLRPQGGATSVLRKVGGSSPQPGEIRPGDTLHIALPQFVPLQNGTNVLVLWLL